MLERGGSGHPTFNGRPAYEKAPARCSSASGSSHSVTAGSTVSTSASFSVSSIRAGSAVSRPASSGSNSPKSQPSSNSPRSAASAIGLPLSGDPASVLVRGRSLSQCRCRCILWGYFPPRLTTIGRPLARLGNSPETREAARYCNGPAIPRPRRACKRSPCRAARI